MSQIDETVTHGTSDGSQVPFGVVAERAYFCLAFLEVEMQIRLIATVGVLVVAGCVVFYLVPGREVPERVEYKSYDGDEPVVVNSSELQPVSELESLGALPATHVEPRQLLEYSGLVELPEDSIGTFVKVELHKGKLIHNQGVELSTPRDKTHAAYSVRLNAPGDPGEYEVVLRWGPKQFVGRGRLVVETPNVPN